VDRAERRCAYCRCKLRSGNMGVVCGCTTCQAAMAALETYVGLRDIADVRAESWKYTSTIDWDFHGSVYFRCGNPKRYRISYHTSAVATA